MVTFIVHLSDLNFLSPHIMGGGLSTAQIIEVIREQFDYLPGELQVEVLDGVATIQYEGASKGEQTEAVRLFEKAAKRAKSGEFQKAKDIYERVLELDPAMADARRELAMTLFELGEMEGAKNQLIDALRLQSGDAWSYVVLGNIYVKHDRDLATAVRFFTRALELKPGDPYALNGLAAVSQDLGDAAKAAQCFDQAITAHPEFANAWLGKAFLFNSLDQPAQVVEVLDAMFSRAEMMDARSQPIFARGRRLYLSAQRKLAEVQSSEAFKALENYKSEVGALSGYPVKVRTETGLGQLSGVAQMAWKHRRDHHLVQVSDRLPPPCLQHVEAHELTHVFLESLARKEGRNRWFTTTEASRELASDSLSSDIKKLERKGDSGDSIPREVLDLTRGLCGCLFNAPLDMWIEAQLHRDLPSLRPAQFVSLHRLAEEALEAVTNPEIRQRTPPKVLRALTALNGASALFLDDLTHGATDFWRHYQRLDGANLSTRLFLLWQNRGDALQPGDEYDLVDAFADVLGLRGWYEWQPDPGTHEITEEPVQEGSTNPELLQEKHPAAVWFLLDALKRFAPLDGEQVRAIAFEIGRLGQSGLDYASPEKKYTLETLPNETFTGLQLMCLMYAGFKRIAPDFDSGSCEDPRITFVEPLQRYVMTYTALSPRGPRIAFALSDDLFHWERMGLAIFMPYEGVDFNDVANKDALIFPVAIPDAEGLPAMALIHRPLFPGTSPDETAHRRVPRVMDILRESIWISYRSLVNETCDKHHHLCHFDSHERLATPVAAWEQLKIGGGTPPILTRHGWLTIYHGVSKSAEPEKDGRQLCYSAGVMVLSKEHPQTILCRSPEPVLTPESAEELRGTIANVVFPTGIDRRDDLGTPDRFDVYYGMADSRIGVTRLDLPEHLPPGAPQAKD